MPTVLWRRYLPVTHSWHSEVRLLCHLLSYIHCDSQERRGHFGQWLSAHRQRQKCGEVCGRPEQKCQQLTFSQRFKGQQGLHSEVRTQRWWGSWCGLIHIHHLSLCTQGRMSSHSIKRVFKRFVNVQLKFQLNCICIAPNHKSFKGTLQYKV